MKKEYDVFWSYESRKQVDQVNELQKQVLVNKILKYYNNNIQGKHFAVWGLAFKPNTDDMREAPSIAVIKGLLDAGATLKAYDPVVKNYAGVQSCDKAIDSVENSDALIILTEWKEFNAPDFETMKLLMKSPVIYDGRNMYEPLTIEEAGFDYYPIGRKNTATIESPSLVPTSTEFEMGRNLSSIAVVPIPY